ncbi:hypothetical protein QO002_003282 [Pararhizobium capsulatum DSM 1112]|uniref:Nucleotidyltransferase domain-containing protein n=1 Tax=Pararhizobium capsulatum DSM 1112 TaxID=1121113 RepID=A0ABU0BTY1_9HYPH|nr:hypothetical protein [Pararhizobium capsulatum]MDQ0321144.1 hypothetical protein [Pararhizobium capsulatum DSM 1112]
MLKKLIRVAIGDIIPNLADGGRIDEEVLEICIRCKEHLFLQLGIDVQTLYVRGSVAIGSDVPMYSDLDLVGFCNSTSYDKAEADVIVRRIGESYSRFSLIDLQIVCAPHGVALSKNLQLFYNLSLQRILAVGPDIMATIPRITSTTYLHRTIYSEYWLESNKIKEYILKGVPFSYAGEPRGPDFLARWYARLFLRLSVMQMYKNTGYLVSDLETCATICAAYRPEHAQVFEEFFVAERFPPKDPRQVLTLIAAGLSLSREHW